MAGQEEELPGILVVLSGPSGVGKTTVAQCLIDRHAYVRSVSVTTRERREREVDGEDYLFISVEEFERLRDRQELIEHARVYDNYYGTPKQPLREALKANKAYLLVIDVNGGYQIRGKGYNSEFVFLTPPNTSELVRRLDQRGTDDMKQRTLRLNSAEIELEKAKEIYNHIVVNDDLEKCTETVHAHVLAARKKLLEKKKAGEPLYPGLDMQE